MAYVRSFADAPIGSAGAACAGGNGLLNAWNSSKPLIVICPQAVRKKDELIAQLREQLASKEERVRATEDLLRRQREDLLSQLT